VLHLFIKKCTYIKSNTKHQWHYETLVALHENHQETKQTKKTRKFTNAKAAIRKIVPWNI